MAFKEIITAHRFVAIVTALLLSTLAACGGGGGAAASATGTATAASPADPTPPTGATPPDSSASSPASPSSPDGAGSAASAPSNIAAVGTARALSAAASLAVDGVPEQPPAASALATGMALRTFYIDSSLGSDQNDGRAAAASSGGSGPWRTLGRLMQSDLKAGDSVTLACSSVWNETLRLPASGTAALPITVSAPASRCKLPPTIDGSVNIAATAWTQHSGNIWKTPLTNTPLQLFAASGVFTEAHHPNRGHLASDTTSPYVAMAANGNVVVVNGQSGSTTLTTGADLALPAGASITPGTRVRVRSNAWMMEQATVASVSGATLTFSQPTAFPLLSGWGYLLLGQLWMVDSAGEWFYDAGSKVLYAWMPDSTAPAAAVSISTLAVGADLESRQYVVLDGLTIRRVGIGIKMRSTLGVQVRNSTIQDTADIGADAAVSAQAAFDSNTFLRTGGDAIAGTGSGLGYARGMAVRNNLIRDSGVVMEGEAVLSVPRRSLAAIFAGDSGVATGNTIINAGYVGIMANAGSVLQENFIYGACTLQDDCGGIYTGGANNNGQIRRNTIVHARGSLAGQPAAIRGTSAQGIYIDQGGTGITVEDNTVIDTDNGIQLHNAYANIVRANRLYGNRSSQIWMQEDDNSLNASGDVSGNLIQGNLVAAVTPSAVGLALTTRYAGTSGFASIDGNRYYDRASPAVAYTSAPSGVRGYTLAQWRASAGAGSTSPVDVTGTGTSLRGYTNFSVAGNNLVPNSALLLNAAGWSSWNGTAPAGQIIRESCPAGVCVRYVPGGSNGILSSPGFEVQQGRWYRLSVDLATGQDSQAVPLLVRIGGADYGSLSDRNLGVTAGRTWARYTMIFQATRTVDPTDASTGHLPARVDIDSVEVGKWVSMANLELVPITPDVLAQVSGAFINVGVNVSTQACPFTTSQPTLCGKFFNLANDQSVTWPLSVPARSALILYAQEPTLLDSDGDGIPDAQDLCPGTPAGVAVNASGCGFGQR